MIVVGLTGGIASGKTTILKFIKKLKIPTHDSDKCVGDLYKKPSKELLKHLRNIGLRKAIKENKIDKKIIQTEVFKSKKLLKSFEKFIHNEVAKSRNTFLIKNKKLNKKIVFLDIPLLFEKKLEAVCDYVFLAYSPKHIRKERALKIKKIDKKTLDRIISFQTPEKVKKNKSDFIIQTSINKRKSYNQLLKAIKTITDNKK